MIPTTLPTTFALCDPGDDLCSGQPFEFITGVEIVILVVAMRTIGLWLGDDFYLCQCRKLDRFL